MHTGVVREAQLFVASFDASSYTYADATMTDSLPDWIGSHCRAFDFYGGIIAQIVPDKPKSGITKAFILEPVINRAYCELEQHLWHSGCS